MWNKVEAFLKKYEALVLVLLLGLVLLVNGQGLSWGLPSGWNPDELAIGVASALDGRVDFNQTNFDYPSLPKYVMLFAGRVTDALGYSRDVYRITARFLSVFLGAMSAWVAYGLVRQLGGKRWNAVLAALLVVTNSELALNSHFAHNDLCVTFFAGLTLFFTLKYMSLRNRAWLYTAFFSAGLTASSKYNGGIIVLGVLLAYGLVEGRQLFKERLRLFETIFVGAGLSILGYGLGTPTALTSFSFYVKRLLPALWRHANYNRTPTSRQGWQIQWGVMGAAFGDVLAVLFVVTLAAFLAIRLVTILGKKKDNSGHSRPLLVTLATVILLDLPILFSYNVQSRFFLPLLIPLSALLGLAAGKGFAWLAEHTHPAVERLAAAALGVLLVFSALRVASVNALISNDARIPAGAFVAGLPAGASIEYTFYSPNNVDSPRFSASTEHPLVFLKFVGQELPANSLMPLNTGEEGVEDRKPDYFVASSFIYERFNNDYTCETHQEECDFFIRLLAGETNYREIAGFSYELPWYLPEMKLPFINPEIRIFERVPLADQEE